MLLQILTTVLVFSCFQLSAQIISQFEFDSNPVTSATIGPDASFISSSATSSPGGVGGTNGLNAGLPKMDINMVIPGSPIFDVGGIDVSFDFQRDENGGRFLERGQSLRIDGISNLSVSYRVDDGLGGYNVVNSGNIYGLPNDDIFRNYRFVYSPCDGVGMVLVDNVIVWTNDGPDNRNMYWVGAGDFQFGNGMDGTGYNKTMVDNLIIEEEVCSALPVDFISLTAELKENRDVEVKWNTTTEVNNSHFVIERRSDFNEWDSIGTVQGAGNSLQPLSYSFVDYNPLSNTSYYRLKQVDYDGQFSYSSIASVYTSAKNISIHPNPSEGVFVLDHNFDISIVSEYIVYDSSGRPVLIEGLDKNKSSFIDLTNQENGLYILHVGDEVIRLIKN